MEIKGKTVIHIINCYFNKYVEYDDSNPTRRKNPDDECPTKIEIDEMIKIFHTKTNFEIKEKIITIGYVYNISDILNLTPIFIELYFDENSIGKLWFLYRTSGDSSEGLIRKILFLSMISAKETRSKDNMLNRILNHNKMLVKYTSLGFSKFTQEYISNSDITAEEVYSRCVINDDYNIANMCILYSLDYERKYIKFIINNIRKYLIGLKSTNLYVIIMILGVSYIIDNNMYDMFDMKPETVLNVISTYEEDIWITGR